MINSRFHIILVHFESDGKITVKLGHGMSDSTRRAYSQFLSRGGVLEKTVTNT